MTRREAALVAAVWHHYETAGRHTLPWRQTHDPYQILVSEVMLQQTQVDRVVPKYEAFIARFPNLKALATAPLGEVLRLWQGLGYNRRAKALQAAAQMVLSQYSGVVPGDEAALRSLPGVGVYTARAVLAFAFAVPLPLIETNVRTVFLYHLFPDATDVTDDDLWPHVVATLDGERPREWYYALMDYGAHLKRTAGNNISRSRHYIPQSRFAGSDRQLRGAIIRALAAGGVLTAPRLYKAVGLPDELRFDAQLAALCREGMVSRTKRSYHLPL